MSYPLVADPDHAARKFPVRAITIHFAEGGGTVGYLQRKAGVSCHYVVERSGRIVQMVRESQASFSVNPKLVRTTNDPPFTYLGERIVYGVSANKAALGDAWRDPNAAIIAIEVEGFAKDGPNPDERSALRALVRDIRSRFPGLPMLGHRDFQSYKACPGKLVPWADYGGHGPQSEEPDMPGVRWQFADSAKSGWVTIVGDGHSYLNLSTGTLHPIAGGDHKRAFGVADLIDRGIGGPNDPRKTGYVINQEAAFVITDDVEFEPDEGDATHKVTLRVDDNVVAEVTV